MSLCVRRAPEQVIMFYTFYRYVIFVFPVRGVYDATQGANTNPTSLSAREKNEDKPFSSKLQELLEQTVNGIFYLWTASV